MIGRILAGKFLIESLLGSGGMGAVYRARHLLLDKVVAVKVMHDEAAANAAFAARFRREAKAASRLDHPNSIRVIDFGEDDGLLYIAMEYLDGTDLFRTIERDWPLSDERTVDILSQVLSALAVAHDMKIVHRDLKPENIMILSRTDDDGRPHDVVKVCDFGIAKMTDTVPPPAPGAPRGTPGRALSTKGAVIGTPEYMAPEQCRGESPDARTDLYAVGVILYQLLTARIPFVADNAIDLVLKHVSEEPIPPTTVNPRASPTLEAVCLRALQKRPEERFATAREMRAEMRAAIGGVDSGRAVHAPSSASGQVQHAQMSVAETLPAFASVPAPLPRRRGRAAAALALLVIVGAGALLAFRLRDEPNRVERGTRSSLSTPIPSASFVAEPLVSVASTPEPRAFVSAFSPVPRGPKPAEKQTLAATASPTAVATSMPAPAMTQALASSAVVAIVSPSSGATGAASIATDPSPSPVVPPPTLTPFDPAKGSVAWSVLSAGGGATMTNVSRALARAASGWTSCYQTGLRARGARAEGTATLRLACDEEGRVVGATFSGLDLPDVAACIRRASIGTTIPNVDTGAAWATVALTFQVAK